MSVKTREEAINYLVTNCSCERTLLEQFSNEALAGIYSASTVNNQQLDVESMEDGAIENALQVLVNEANKRNNSMNEDMGLMEKGTTTKNAKGTKNKFPLPADEEDEEDLLDGGADEDEEDDTENEGKNGGGNHSAHTAAKKGATMKGAKVNLPGTPVSTPPPPATHNQAPTMNEDMILNAMSPQMREVFEMGRQKAIDDKNHLIETVKEIVANSTSEVTKKAILANLKEAANSPKPIVKLTHLINMLGGPISNRPQPMVYGAAGPVVENANFDDESIEDAPMPPGHNRDWKTIERDLTLQRGGRPLFPVQQS